MSPSNKNGNERELAELRLGVQYVIARALAESDRLSEAAPRILQAVCESLGWELGALWRIDREAKALRCVETWHVAGVEVPEFEEESRRQTFTEGVGFPGRVWALKKPAWLTDITSSNLPRAPFAERAGLHGAFAFPIRLRDEILGVMEFFTRDVREPDEPLLQMMETVGSQIGQFIERKAAEEELRHSEERFRMLAETASDAIITIDEESRIIFTNRTAENVFGYKIEEMMDSELTMLMPDYLRHLHSAGLARYIETGQKHINWEGYELPGLHKDGHEIPLEVSFSEWTKSGKRYFTGIVRDITERKRTAEVLAERARLSSLGADIGVALTQGDNLRDLLQRCAETLVEHLDAAFARVWTLNRADNVLELQASAGMYTHLDGGHARVPVGRFKIGLIAEERRAHLTNDVVGDERVGDQEWAAREGMVAFAGYPLIVDGRMVGVMAMFARHALTPATLEAMASVANGIALGIERKRAEETLREQKDELARLSEERAAMLEEVSTPVVPVWRNVLVLPLIGSLDTERMQRATDAALGEVVRTGARTCIIDITGARIVDTHAVANLSNLVASLKLIGAEAIVTGIKAQAAQTLVGLGVDFSDMRTHRTLAEALATIIKTDELQRDGILQNGTGKNFR